MGLWDFVKGGGRENETMIDAIKREILEETGIEKLVVVEELADKICFEFPSNVKRIIGYDAQETTMYIARISKQLHELSYEDDEIDEYYFSDKDQVYDKLSQTETKGFWKCVIKEF